MGTMKIAVAGYGVEGRALARYFRRRGHEVTVCDESERVKKELAQANVRMKLGPHYLEDLDGYDLIFRSPGIPYGRREFDPVRRKLTSATRYFFENSPCPIAAVTGTKGKGTTATLLHEMARNGLRKKAWIGGNIGRPPLEFLDELSPQDLVILELSSFQLQDLNQSPRLAVVLGITPDHLDHHRTMEEYVEAKRAIVRFQKPADTAVLDADNSLSAGFADSTRAKVHTVSLKKAVSRGAFLKAGAFMIKEGKTGIMVGRKGETRLRGDHNIKNILAAAAAAHALAVPVSAIAHVIREFPGLPHRLEMIGEIGGVGYCNDSASTNPETAIAALRCFSSPVILIAGGSDKGVDFAPLGEEIALRPNVKTVVLMGTTKPKLERVIETAVGRAMENLSSAARREHPLELILAENYQEAFMVARMVASAGDTVLLSPACASFDMFEDYRQRGDAFRNFVLDMNGAL